MLDEALRLFDHHLGDLDVALRGLVERGGDHLTLHAALHVGDFLGSLVDQQHDQEHFGMVVGDRLRHVLEKDGLADARRGDDQRALTLALGADDVDHARRAILDRRILRIERQLALWIERREIVEIDAMAHRIGIVEIDRDELGQREIALAILGRADLAFHGVARAQPELADLIGREIDVVGAGEIIRLGRAEEAEAVGQHFDRAHAHDLLAILGLGLEDGEEQVLLAQRGGALDAERLGGAHQFGGGGFLEVFEMHGYSWRTDRLAKRTTIG